MKRGGAALLIRPDVEDGRRRGFGADEDEDAEMSWGAILSRERTFDLLASTGAEEVVVTSTNLFSEVWSFAFGSSSLALGNAVVVEGVNVRDDAAVMGREEEDMDPRLDDDRPRGRLVPPPALAGGTPPPAGNPHRPPVLEDALVLLESGLPPVPDDDMPRTELGWRGVRAQPVAV